MIINTFYQHLILVHWIAFVICENYYSIIAPGVIKSNRKYTAIVTLHNSSTPCSIRVSILGQFFNASDEVRLEPFETKKIDFFPPKLDNNDYQLLAEGLRGCNFRNETKVYSDSFAGPKIYIQTDRSVYKPLDLVQFRVVILDEHTRPLNIREPIRVEIFDDDKNRIKQYKDIILTKGVFTDKFQISQQPVMGNWEIRVVLSGKYSYEKSKTISVQMYILPKFSLYVNAVGFLVPEENKITAEVYGKYTFDKYVEGLLNVELRSSKDELIDRQTHHIDGLFTVEFHLQNPKRIGPANYFYMKIMLEEQHTGIQKHDTRTIFIRSDSYRILIPDNEIEFRNNRPFRLKAIIQHWKNGPATDTKTPVFMQHGSKKYKTFLNDNGVAIFEFDYQEDASYTVTFKDSMRTLPSIQLYRESDEVIYCKLKLLEGPRLGKPVEIKVTSSFNIPYLVYTVVGHATIVQMKHIQLAANQKSYIIKITPSIEMVPKSFLYVYYILDGHLRYEELQLEFPMELENQISVRAPQQVKPGQEVTLNLKAEPKSYVSILAVDLSVFLLDEKYDIYKNTILEDLLDDVSYVPDAHIVRPGIISGLITLTNAHYPITFTDINIAKGAREKGLDFRTKFPETWIFENYEINNTDTEIKLNIPDTITTWRITAFSNNAIQGFGIVDGPTDITTILPFFISLNLPQSVKRDEVVVIPVTVFNYHKQSLDTELTMFNDHMQFQFMEPSTEHVSRNKQTKSTLVPANGGMTVKFLIKLLKIGEIELRIAANNSLYTDGVVHKLKVLPEGLTKYENKARYLSAVDEKLSLSVDIPRNSVSDSEIITLTVGGDFMMPSLENIHQMVNLPTGCGEQNMVNFAPNILILDYLRATGKLSKEKNLVKKAKFYTDIGYQQQLSYRHKYSSPGGYSVFGERYSKEASTWLTAYVTRFFIKASKYVPIESRIIDSGLDFLAQTQLFDGSFPYTGYLFYKELENKYGFTAFVLLTFMEDRKYSRKYQSTIQKGLDFITSHLDDINDDIYALSIITAALSKAKHSSTDKVIQKLQSQRKEDESGLMWWSGNGNNVETTAYVLLALLNQPGNHLPILKWLVQQRNTKGGFKTTHDTVLGLEALVKFSQKYNNASSWDMKILYSAQDENGKEAKVGEFLINDNNALLLQQHELPTSVRLVNFEISGSGYSLVQLSSQYNVKKDIKIKYFNMNINPNIYNEEQLDLEVCFTYHARKGINNSTNMVIMEANLPTGYKTEAELSRDLMENDFIQRVETKNEETVMILYFDKLSTDVKHCVTIEAFRANEVVERQPAAIVMYDYYNNNRINSQFYTI